jgi:putative transposase
LIARLKADFPVSFLCNRLQVSVSGFYDWAGAGETRTLRRRIELTGQVMTAFAVSRQAAGYRKVTAALHRSGTAVNRKTVAGIMREHGLVPAATARAFRIAKIRRARGTDPVDLLNRDFNPSRPGAVLVGDITQIPTGQGWLYLATVIDLASRKVLGHATGGRMDAGLAVRALAAARRSGLLRPGTVFHSDHGSQYRSIPFQRHCRRHGILRSMGARFQCWDNAVAESFFAQLKNERLHAIRFTSRTAAAAEVDRFVEHYNTGRLHQALGYRTPEERLTELLEAA